jgi:hypothetical protein
LLIVSVNNSSVWLVSIERSECSSVVIALKSYCKNDL